MHRNLHNRVELVVPILEMRLREKIWDFLEVSARDNRRAWDLLPTGEYVQRKPQTGDQELGSQEVMMAKTMLREKNLGGE
jgi:polyphosphate kinase